MNTWEQAIANWQGAVAVFIVVDVLLIGGMFWQGIWLDVKQKNRRKFVWWYIGIVNVLALAAAVSVMLWYQP